MHDYKLVFIYFILNFSHVEKLFLINIVKDNEEIDVN